ncbi:MAG: hypothetical protein KGV44_07320 [Flavobacteriaceae bacterium]|nr:hypothetical protein [Flavobacteriaceae bacterium]
MELNKQQLKIFVQGLFIILIALVMLFVGVKIFRENYKRTLNDTNHYGYKIYKTDGVLESIGVIPKPTSSTRDRNIDVLVLKLFDNPNTFVLIQGVFNDYEEIEQNFRSQKYARELRIFYTDNTYLYDGYVEILQIQAGDKMVYSYEQYKRNELFAVFILLFAGIIMFFLGIVFIKYDGEIPKKKEKNIRTGKVFNKI